MRDTDTQDHATPEGPPVEGPPEAAPSCGSTEPQAEAGPPSPGTLRAAMPYALPYALFAALTFAADALPRYRSVAYIVKVLVVGAALWAFRKTYTELKVGFSRATLGAAAVGLLVIVAWIGLDPYYPQTWQEAATLSHPGALPFMHLPKELTGFNPYQPGLLVPPLIAIVFRIFGAVVLVPIFEELFWRSWLIRWLVKEDFRAVPMGAFTWTSFLAASAIFGFTHHEWLAGILCGAAFNLLLYWRKDLFLCVVAHAVANAALAAWVLTQYAWGFW